MHAKVLPRSDSFSERHLLVQMNRPLPTTKRLLSFRLIRKSSRGVWCVCEGGLLGSPIRPDTYGREETGCIIFCCFSRGGKQHFLLREIFRALEKEEA
ncbi:hypothetical protein CEXT_351441 [Caerostris extrusa]|uniref:Uncharacterized protein n=1 Tax=Caerostris extrusa TaxID=172846 RepID=A0AAV4RPH7_CAEEX|nr:hypothetical protein CEXT_351441 [Caerostris extrusa]